MAREELVEHRLAHRVVGALAGLPLEIGPDARPQLVERVAAAVVAREVVVERRQLLRAQIAISTSNCDRLARPATGLA